MSFTSWLGQKIGLTGERARRFWASFAGSKTGGEPVTPDRAMSVAAFNRGIRLTAETVATLPARMYRVDALTGDGAIDTDNPYDTLIRVSPNEYQTTVEFMEGMVGAMMWVGNGYARKARVGGRITSLEPLDPQRSYPWRNSQNALRYRGYDFYGTYYPDLAPEDVWHLKGFGFGGDCGMSTVQWGASSIGLSLAANRVASETFESGLSSNGFIETGQVLEPDDRERLEKIMATYQSNRSPGKMMILEGGMKFNKLGMTAVDAQLLATLGFNIEEIGRLLGMPPILLGHSSAGQTMWGTGVEGIIQAWYTLGLRSVITRVEKSFGKHVIDPSEMTKFYLKLNVNGLLRGDSQTQAAIASTLAQNGLRNRDELRALDDLTPIPGGAGKLFTAQTNLAPVSMLGHNGGPPLNPVEAALQNMIRIAVDERLAAERAATRH